jgi:pSer/pThr/pTyr-binding forkhead associated (FHA) protein
MRIMSGGNSMAASLVCIIGPYAGKEFPVDGKGVIIGRDPATANIVLDKDMVSRAHQDYTVVAPFATIVLDADMVSRAHTKVYAAQDGGVIVEDLGSTNGTYLMTASGCKKISGKELVGDKQRFSIGDNDYCVFEVRSAD